MKPPDLKKVKATLKETPYPINLIIEAVSNCNLRCLACPYPILKRKKGKMSDKIYKKIIDEIAKNSPSKTTIWFAFMGEPLLMGDGLIKMIKYAKMKGIENAYLNTNAILLNEKMADSLVESGIDKIIVSIDAFKENSYKKIRRGGNYKILKNNILYLLKIIKQKKLKKPEVLVQFIIMDENRNEENAFKDFWLKKGAIVKIRRKLGWGDSIEAKDLVIPQEKRQMPCPWLMRQMVILWDGRVAQCDADYEGEYSAGNINRKSISAVWNGELKKRRKKHLNNNFNFKPCQSCNDWQVGLSEIHFPHNKK